MNKRHFVGLLTALILASGVLVLIGCGYQESPTVPAPTPASTGAQASVDISDFAFEPQTLQFSPGTEVVWTNKDSATHTVTSRDDIFDSGSLPGGATFSDTFDQNGTFEYYCTIHPSMTGTIVAE